MLVSCSPNQSVPTTTTTQITIATLPTTVAPINYGSDCNGIALDEIVRLDDLVTAADGKWYEEQQNWSDNRWDIYSAYTSSYRDLRSYIRTLDIPLVSTEQKKYIDAIQDLLSAGNRYMESDGEDLSVNDYLIPLSDARTDFYNAIWESCDR